MKVMKHNIIEYVSQIFNPHLFCFSLQNLTLEQDPFRPTSDDLAGFWDMVYIQVEHINTLFAELTALRKNGWVSIKPLVSKYE